LGLKPIDIHKILFTHGHADHIGGAVLFPRAEKWMSLHDGLLVNAKSDYFTVSSSFMQDFYPEIDFFYKPGQVFEIVDFVFKVIDTPGHTKGSVCFYDEESGVLFSGDTLFNGAFGRFDLPSGNRSDLIASIRKLSCLDFKYLYPGHGSVLEKKQAENIKYCLVELENSGI
jgi:glyoxylase-like metal-dependent hydrolase (beta-lactamase superfamily II)